MSSISYQNKKVKFNNKSVIMQKKNYYFSTINKVCNLNNVKTSEKVVFIMRNAIKNEHSLTDLGKMQAKNFGLDIKTLYSIFENNINYYSNDCGCCYQTLQFISEGYNKNTNPNMQNIDDIFNITNQPDILLSTIIGTTSNGINIISTDHDDILQNLISYCTDDLIKFDENKHINYLSGVCLLVNDSDVTCIPVTAMISGFIANI